MSPNKLPSYVDTKLRGSQAGAGDLEYRGPNQIWGNIPTAELMLILLNRIENVST